MRLRIRHRCSWEELQLVKHFGAFVRKTSRRHDQTCDRISLTKKSKSFRVPTSGVVVTSHDF